MCEKCREIDKNIGRYRRMLLAIGDQLTIDRTKEMTACTIKFRFGRLSAGAFGRITRVKRSGFG
jgi:hypothetical protein